MTETIVVFLMLLLFVVPFLAVKLWWWAAFFGCVSVLLGAFEWYLSWRYDKTLSQQFWQWSKSNKTKSKLVITSISAGWILLILHLLMG